MGRDPNDYEHVADRAGHDRRYAIDSSKIKRDLGWRPRHTDIRAGLAETIGWYRSNPDWWQPGKAEAEEFYRERGQ
jgi:dTDP-glucose 4,6-dehydratase